jgi:hypothetical protein
MRENGPSVLLVMLNHSPPLSIWCAGNSARVIFKLSFVETGCAIKMDERKYD